MLKYYFYCFLISMIPLIELRGAIPYAAGWGLIDFNKPWTIAVVYVICILGNMLPVPFIYYFATKFLEWGSTKKGISKICSFFLQKGNKASKKLIEKAERKIENNGMQRVPSEEAETEAAVSGETVKRTSKAFFIALVLFVGIPLPGTGAWTGTLASSLLNMKFKDAVIAVALGVLLAGLIMLGGSLGIFAAIKAAIVG